MTNESDIIKTYLSGLSQSKVASIFGVSQGTVSNILARNGVSARTLIEAASRKDMLNTRFFNEIDTPEKAYWIGFITADGNISNNTITIKLNQQDAAHLSKFLQHIESSSSITFSTNNIGTNYAQIKIHSVCLSTALAKNGVGSNKTWTALPWSGPNDLMCHYWRGVVDGDGWISTASNGKNKNFFTVGLCGNLNIVTGFRDYVHCHTGYNNNVTVRTLESGNKFGQIAYTGTFRANDVCKLLCYDSDYVSLDRKRTESAAIFSHDPNQKRRNFDLSNDDALQIITDNTTGNYRQADLAQKYNVGKGTIYNVINRKGRFSKLP